MCGRSARAGGLLPLLLCLLCLAAPSAQAGYYAVTPVFTGTGYTSHSDPDDLAAGNNTKLFTTTYPPANASQGSIKFQFVWMPNDPNHPEADPPPTSVLVEEDTSAHWISDATGSANDGFWDAVVPFQDQYGDWEGESKGMLCSIRGGASFETSPISPYADGDWEADVSYSATACPITLAAPNLLGHPDQGDGTNQYVYDNAITATSSGNLVVPGVISAPGASSDAMCWLHNAAPTFSFPVAEVKLDLPVESAIQACYEVWSPELLTYRFGGTFPFDQSGMWFLGMPHKNSGLDTNGKNIGFGDHTATLMVVGQAKKQAHIQTFFSAKGNNYPGYTENGVTYPSAQADHDSSNADVNQRFWTPNWYHYYDQVYKSPGMYEPGNQTQTDCTAFPYNIHIEDQTYGTIPGIHVYALKPGATTISWAGNIELSGIWLYIMVCAHEKEHQDACNDGTYVIDPNQNNPLHPVVQTSDHDSLDNTWENNHYFDSTLPQTTRAPNYPNETDAADDEAIADIVGLGHVLDELDKWQQDWAGVPSGDNYEGGLRFGTSHLAIKPGDTYPTPYFVFTPQILQNGAWIEGTPIKIWSKENLKTAVPGLMTTLLTFPDRPQ